MCSGLLHRGVASFLVSPEDGPLVKVARDAGLDCGVVACRQPAWSAPWETWAARRRWLRVLHHVQAALIHANGLKEARSISFAAKKAGIPLISHVRWPPGDGFMEWAWRWVPAPEMFVFNSRSLLGDHAQAFARICPKSALEVVHNAVDLNEFPVRPPHRGSPPARPRVAIIANLVAVKGHKDFLKMATIVRQGGIAADFLIMGDDRRDPRYSGQLKRYCRRRQLENAVRFMGHVPNVGRALQDIDVVVVPSHVEPFGRSTIEAMACQVPVVASRVGGLPEIVIDGETGLLVDKGVPEQLAEAVVRLLQDGALRQRMGEAGRRRVESVFNQRDHAGAMLDLYRRVLADHGGKATIS